MSRWRDVWRESVRAFCVLCADRNRGEKEFERLLAAYANDPMVVYERAEAYEHIGEREWARTDYADAAARFVEPHWSEVARLGAEQVKGRPLAGAGSLPARQLRERIHSLHAFPQLPPSVLADALSGVARLDSERNLVAMNLRAALEQLVWRALYLSNATPADDAELWEMIDLLEQRRLVSGATRPQMHVVRRMGNKAAHGHEISQLEAENQLRSFRAVADWYCQGPWAKSGARTGRSAR